jgi:MOB kinase activator 1
LTPHIIHHTHLSQNLTPSLPKSTNKQTNKPFHQVALPPGESCAGWVAVHAIDFYNDVSTIWAVMAEDPYLDSFRPGEGFPSGVEYRWSEGSGKDATTVSVSAPVYIEKVLQWIQDQINKISR